MKKLWIIITTVLLLTACQDEQTEDQKPAAANIKVSPDERLCSEQQHLGTPKQEQTPQSAAQVLQQEGLQLSEAVQDMTQTLQQLGNSLENDLNNTDVNDLAKQLGELAKKAGASAKSLEKTTQTLGEAIQKGFEEGYNQNKEQ